MWLLTLLLLLPAAARAATVAFSPQTPHRVDFQTFLISPTDRPGWRQVNAFIGLSARPDSACTGVLLLPVDGVPEDVRAQAVGLAQFDAAVVHGRALEGAFQRRSSAERNTTAALWTGICLTGGPPAWLALALHWPPRGLSRTAIVPTDRLTNLPAHRPQQARILIGEKGLAKVPIPMKSAVAAAMALSSSRCVIAVTFEPGSVSEKQFTLPASSGVRVSFRIPLGRHGSEEALRMVMAASPGRAPTLTRVYVQSGSGAAPELLGGGANSSTSSPQGLIYRAMAGFGYSEEFLRQNSEESASVRLDTVRRLEGGLTVRLTAVSTSWTEPPCVIFHWRPLGWLGILRAGAGTALEWLLWPILVAAYLCLLWLSVRVYRRLAGFAPAALPAHRLALLAALVPFVTPFFAWRCLPPNEQVVNDPVGDGALSVLPPTEYQALARLVTWACFAAVHLALMLFFVHLTLWLCFG